MKQTLGKNSIMFTIVIAAFGIVFFSILSSPQNIFGLEENFVILQTGIISTQDKDFAISNDFETRIYQNGKIMRLSGITTTGEPYYIYQKNIGDEISIKGKILLSGKFVSVVQKEIVPEPQIFLEPDTEIIMATKIPHHTYARYPFIILVKVFDADQNPQPKYDQKLGVLNDIFVNVTITNKSDKLVTSLIGNTDATGVFRGTHNVRDGIDLPGEYKVNVTIGERESSTTQSFITFFRGDVRDYWDNR